VCAGRELAETLGDGSVVGPRDFFPLWKNRTNFFIMKELANQDDFK
jgi:hypothetical protein